MISGIQHCIQVKEVAAHNLKIINTPYPSKEITLPGTFYNIDTSDTTAYTTIPTTFTQSVQLVKGYTVTLNTNNGTINSGNVTSYTYGTGATLPTDVTRTGYTFDGWYENSDLTGTAVTNISTTDTGNKTYYAKWNRITTSGLQVGDYIKYDTGNTTVGENGVVDCIVLYNDTEHGLQIITANSIQDVTLGYKNANVDMMIPASMSEESDFQKAKWSYNNAIETLNSYAEKYLNTAYALDARSVGSTPTINVNGIFTAKNSENEGPIELPFTYTGTEDVTGIKAEDNNYVEDYNAMVGLNIDRPGDKICR